MRYTKIRNLSLAAIGFAGAFTYLTVAYAAGCQEAWFNRNYIYKDAGYCFKTERAIKAFGNEKCRFDNIADVKLSSEQQKAVNDMVAEERKLGCKE